MDVPAQGDSFRGSDRFERVAHLGRGWSGSVYRVLDRESGAVVAAKVLDVRDPERLYRLKQEFRSLARIRHPNLVELYELVVGPDECFFTMEFIDGVDFLGYVRGLEGEESDDSEALLARFRNAAAQLATAVAALHRSGTLHRDLKPPNVLVDRNGRLVLLDFGLSVALAASGETDAPTGELAGTFAYMAPEQMWGQKVGMPADWYSVGVMLYEALSGRLPFQTGHDKPPMPLRVDAPWVPEGIEKTVLALLRSDPADRPGGELILSSVDVEDGRTRTTGLLTSLEQCFVGRAGERAELRRALERVGPSAPVVIHVHGPSGIGKTELVRRFLEEVESDRGMVVLRGRCHAQETVPYNAFDGLVDALTRFLLDPSSLDVEALLPKDSAALLRLFPVLARVPAFAKCETAESPAEPRELRRMAFEALRELFTKLGESRRLVLWVDDAQWCDEDSRALARELLRTPDPPGLLFVFTHRPEDRERVPFAAAADGTPEGVTRTEISLGPLAVEESRELARLLSGGHQSMDSDTVAMHAAGSPFFVAALVRQRLEARPSKDSREGVDLAAVLRSRVERLPAPEQHLLKVISVAGQPIERLVALDAARVGKQAWTLLINLEKENLLRSVRVRDEEGIEIYHDRIREALLTGLSAGDLREHHRQLADSLSTRPEPDPHALFRHFFGAGEAASAARWGVEAADRADRALAFVEAADLYAQVMPLVAEDRRREIELRRAGALVNAGRGAEAAPIFLAAAPHSPPEERLELRRRAAEQFLVTGHMDEGVEVVRDLLADFGIRYPRTSLGTLAGTLARILMLRLTGVQRNWGARRQTDLARADACNSAMKGLAQVDPLRGLYFAARALSLSLRTRDRFRIGRDLGLMGATLTPLGGTIGRWASGILDGARTIALELDDPYLLGFTSIMVAQRSMVESRWRQMLDLCDSGNDLLRRQCRGVSWELDIGRMAAARALEELGDFSEIERRMELWQREAEGTNDVYGIVEALMYTGLCRLAADDPSGARRLAQRILQLWTVRGFHIQHFYVFRLECYCDLFEARPDDAWARIKSTWPALRRSNLLRHMLLRADAHLLRARVALAVAANAAAHRERLLRDAELDAARLEREGRPDTSGHADLVRAACLAQRGCGNEAVYLLDRAAETYRSAEMELCEAYASFRAAQLSGNEARLASARSVFEKKGVMRPGRLLAAYAPGFPGA